MSQFFWWRLNGYDMRVRVKLLCHLFLASLRMLLYNSIAIIGAIHTFHSVRIGSHSIVIINIITGGGSSQLYAHFPPNQSCLHLYQHHCTVPAVCMCVINRSKPQKPIFRIDAVLPKMVYLGIRHAAIICHFSRCTSKMTKPKIYAKRKKTTDKFEIGEKATLTHAPSNGKQKKDDELTVHTQTHTYKCKIV